MAVSTLPPSRPFGLHLNARAELRRALLAAAETCWVYAILLTCSALSGSLRLLSPFLIFIMYWAGLEIGRYLPRLRYHWRALQGITVGLAALLLLVILRVGLYQAPLLSLNWLAVYFNQLLAVGDGLNSAQIATIALLYVYIRGIGFGQRPLTLWFVGFQFRLGVLIFFLNGLVDILTRSADWRAPLIVFFVVSLLNISLARIEEGGREMAMGRTWAVILAGASVLVVALGFLVTPLFTIATANALFALLTPFAPPFEFLLNLVLSAIFAISVLAWGILGPIFSQLAEVFAELQKKLIGQQLPNQPQGNLFTLPDLTLTLPYLRLVALIAIVLIIALIIANALRQRMAQVEQESFLREAASERDLSGTQKIKSPRATPAPRREIEADNVRRIYAALLARAAEVGTPRREAETPFEFLPRLSAQFPEAAPDLRALTEAYVAVHYAQIPATSAQVRTLRGVWQRVRGQLVKKK